MANVIKDLHADWIPHETQVKVLHAIFYEGKRKIGIECGRKWGKTETVCYVLWRLSLLIANANNYYFGPTSTQAKELIWANNRIKGFGPAKYLAGRPNETELRMRFTSGSFLKIAGSENYEAYRGVGPDVYVYDEYKDFHPLFHPAMEPNEGAKSKDGTLHLVVGTPPETDSHPDDPQRRHPFYEMMDEIAVDPNGAYFNFTTYDNPHIDRKWIDGQRAKYIARGDEAGFMREYMAKRVKGGPGAIFPMWDKGKFVVPHKQMLARMAKDKRNLSTFTVCDPGTETVFGVLFMAVNPYSREVFICGEIYAKSQVETSTSKIIPQIADKEKSLGWQDVTGIYDEAEAWFANEASNSYGRGFLPTHKAWDKKANGLSLIKDQMLYSKVTISDNCPNLIWEIENYVKDRNGNIPKKGDHLIDCWRYGNAAAGLSLEDDESPDPVDHEDTREERAYKNKQESDDPWEYDT